MKIMIVQLSDMHCKVNDGNMSLKIKKLLMPLERLGKLTDRCWFFLGI